MASEHCTDNAITAAEQTGDPSLVAAAHTHMAWVLAHQGEVAARPHAELAWEFFSVHQDAAVLVWHTAITLAWLRATIGNGEGVDEVLEIGAAAWKRGGKPPFDDGALLFEFDHYPSLIGALERQGLRLDREAGRALDSANRVAAAAAHACLARHLRRVLKTCPSIGQVFSTRAKGSTAGGVNNLQDGSQDGSIDEHVLSSRNRLARVALHFARAIHLFRAAGANAALLSALGAAASQAEFVGETEKAATFREEQRQVREALSASSGTSPPADIAPPTRDSDSDKDWVRLDEIDRRYITEVLRHTHGRITGTGGAAAILGLNPSTLSWRIDKLGLRECLAEARRTASTQPKKRKRPKS